MDFEREKALVTGTAEGIGGSITRMLRSAGAEVANLTFSERSAYHDMVHD